MCKQMCSDLLCSDVKLVREVKTDDDARDQETPTNESVFDHYSMLHDCTSRFHKVQLVSEHGTTNLSCWETHPRET